MLVRLFILSLLLPPVDGQSGGLTDGTSEVLGCGPYAVRAGMALTNRYAGDARVITIWMAHNS